MSGALGVFGRFWGAGGVGAAGRARGPMVGYGVEGLIGGAVCQGHLRALKAVWGCWGYLKGVGEGVMGPSGGVGG